MKTFTSLLASISASTEETPFCCATTQPENIPVVDLLELLISGYALSTADLRTAQLKDPVISVLHDHKRNSTKPSAKHGLGQISDVGGYVRDWGILHLRDFVLGLFEDTATN